MKNLGLAETVEKAKNSVPNSRKINGKSFTGDVSLNADDVGAYALGLTQSVSEYNVPWNANSGLYSADFSTHTKMIVNFNMGVGSCPTLQLLANYRNGGLFYRSARDHYGFEEDWIEIYTSKHKPPQNIPVGSPIPWPHANPPTGYFECNGQGFDKNTYPLLASAYPSGVLPDLRGEFIRGLDNGHGVDPNRGILTHQEGTIISGLDDNDTGDISSVGSPGVVFGDPMTDAQWASIKGKKWIYWNREGIENRYDWWAYVSARPRNIAFLYIVRAA
ncbi:phage tail protein [Xenorhabdus bovienii]|uniref:phage tail protein n=1 Tax=Xenorhabdus bovienii TaxID=40576 RepID=UPI0023B2E0D2|nr:phage tail protein [Xenorhabdus bovienii]